MIVAGTVESAIEDTEALDVARQVADNVATARSTFRLFEDFNKTSEEMRQYSAVNEISNLIRNQLPSVFDNLRVGGSAPAARRRLAMSLANLENDIPSFPYGDPSDPCSLASLVGTEPQSSLAEATTMPPTEMTTEASPETTSVASSTTPSTSCPPPSEVSTGCFAKTQRIRSTFCLKIPWKELFEAELRVTPLYEGSGSRGWVLRSRP